MSYPDEQSSEEQSTEEQSTFGDRAQRSSQLPQQPTGNSTSTHRTPSLELLRFRERRRAQVLGRELPLDTMEAAAYLRLDPKTVERMARNGEIPAHPVSGIKRKTWRLFPTELDEWLRAKVNSYRRPCSPNGKDRIK